ncbi:hypothetical protein SALBM135S_06393 [Streptomyces alboniger]
MEPAPRGTAPRRGASAALGRSARLQREARSGAGRPASDGDAELPYPARPQGFGRQRRRVQGAEARRSDHQDGGAEEPCGVGERASLVVEADQEPAGSLDEDEVVLGRQLRGGFGDLVRANLRHPGPPGRGVRRQRLGEAGQFEGGDAGAREPRHLLGVAGLPGADPGLRGLEHRDAPPGRQGDGGHRGRRRRRLP